MVDYRCYFLGAPTIHCGMTQSIDAAEDFSASSDEEARIKVETMYHQRRNQIHGFEIWQRDRLVFRYQAPQDCRAAG
ncbi:MAG: hypothetical protein AB1781_07185 [Pseudomonadota bacterium]